MKVDVKLSGRIQTHISFPSKALKTRGYSGIIIQLCVRALRKLPGGWSHIYEKRCFKETSDAVVEAGKSKIYS